LAPLLGKSKETWSNFDNAQMQRVPYMVHVPGQDKGGINHTYGGEVDALPTLLHLLGVDTSKYIQLGQDLLSKDHDQIVAFRDGDYVTPEYTYYSGSLYSNKDGMAITEPDEALQKQSEAWKEAVSTQLSTSDNINNGDLLRFYSASGLKPIDASQFDYKDGLKKMEKTENKLGDKSTSLFDQKGKKSTQELYKTETYKQYQEQNQQ
jgi:lipoteichoic acid synthase